MRYRYILWDWNGTLTDDMPCAKQAVNDLLADRSRSPITDTQYYAYIDTPIRRFYERVFDLETESYEDIIRTYNMYYRRHMETHGGLRPHTETLLRELRDNGICQWVVTASNTADVEQYLNRFAVREYFDRVLGADNYRAESKVERVARAIRAVCTDAKCVLVVGDTLHDKELADAIGADCALLSGGHQAAELLQAAKPRYLCASMQELREEIL